MIFTRSEQNKINKLVSKLCSENPDIEWVSYDENIHYRNTDYENMLIGFGKGEHTKHTKDDNMSYDTELTYYYDGQLLYYAVVNPDTEGLKIVVYKANNGRMNGGSLLEIEV